MVTGPGGLGEIAAIVVVYGVVCVAFGAVFAVALGPPFVRAVRALSQRGLFRRR